MKHELVFQGKVAFTVTRLSNNIPYALPFVLFGKNDLMGNYASFLKIQNAGGVVGVQNDNGIAPLNTPGDITLVTVQLNPPGGIQGSVLFNYEQTSNPAHADTVLVVFNSEMAYITFLESLQTKKLAYKKLVVNVSDVTLLGQLEEPLLSGPISSAGLQEQTSFTPSTFQDPTDATATAIKLEFPPQKLTKAYGLVWFLMQSSSGSYNVTMTFDLLEEIEKHD